MPPPATNLFAEDLDHVLANTSGLWQSIRNANLFITGGTGFFGRWLLESFGAANDRLGLNARATVLTRDPAKFASKAPSLVSRADIVLLKGDVTSFDFPAGSFPFVIHAATEASAALNESDPLRMSDTIVNGTRRVLEFAQQAGARRFLLTSSGAVYGAQPPAMTHISEDYAGGPDSTDICSAYAEGKRLAEWYCTAFHHRYGLETIIARCFAFVGPYLPLDAHFAAGNFIRDAIAGREIVVNGDGAPYRSYLYAADLAIWLWKILFSGKAGRPYNVGSDQAITIADLAALVARLVPEGRFRIARPAVAGQAAPRYVPSIKRAMDELGLKVSVPVEDAFARTIRFARG